MGPSQWTSVRGADVALHLSATASSADIDEVVTVVLVTTGVAPGAPITLYSPQGAHLWHGLPDCTGPGSLENNVFE